MGPTKGWLDLKKGQKTRKWLHVTISSLFFPFFKSSQFFVGPTIEIFVCLSYFDLKAQVSHAFCNKKLLLKAVILFN